MERAVVDMCVAEIMIRWPATIGIFVACDLHCIGCPIGSFHTLAEAADEHGIALDRLLPRIVAAIEGAPVRDSPQPLRRRSGPAGAPA